MSESEFKHIIKSISKKVSYPEEYLTIEEMGLLIKVIEKRKLKKYSSSNWFWLVIKYMLENAIERVGKKKKRKK